jgi:hypothetical protein
MAVVKPRSAFGEKLRDALLDRQAADTPPKSVKALARVLRPHDVEGMRRNLNRWSYPDRDGKAVIPSPENRAAVATALGLDPSYFDEDDEEDDPVVGDLVRALMGRIDVRVAEAVAKQLGVTA